MSQKKKEIVIEFEYIEKQIQATSKQLDALDKQASQLSQAIEAITKLKDLKESESLVPVVPGVYVKAKLQETDTFLVDVGADVAVPKTAEEAISVFEFQLASTNEYQEKVVMRLESLSKRADELQRELMKIQKGEA